MRIKFIFLFLVICQLVMGQFDAPPREELFRDDVIPRIDILIDEDDLSSILDPDNSQSFELFPCTFIFNNGTVNDTLQDVGFRLRGNTSRNADKKSFKIDINSFYPGRKYYGAEKINLNGQHNDPTSSRAKISADLAREIGVPTMRSNHVLLYINEAFYGVYTNVEHIDEEYVDKRWGNQDGNLYKCLYPADLAYKGANPDLYKEVIFGRRAYGLKTNTEEDDYSDLAEFIDILNNENIEDLPCALESVFNVDQYLKIIAFDILIGNWDGPIYNKNNFYLYHNPETDLFEYIPFDLDNTLGIDWLNKDWGNRNIYNWAPPNEARPIYTRILNVPEYRDRFSYYLQQILIETFNEEILFPYLDAIKEQLYPHILVDDYYPLDYGFDIDDFQNGFEEELPFFQTDYGIKPYINIRRITAFGQLMVNDIAPIISNVAHNNPAEGQYPHITASVADDGASIHVEVCYTFDSMQEVCIPMVENGPIDEASNRKNFSAVIAESFGPGTLSYYVKAVDDVNNESQYPRCSFLDMTIRTNDTKIAINEIMADNDNTIADEAGEYDDWVELYNYGEEEIFLGEMYMTDNPSIPKKWKMPDVSIAPGMYILFWMDKDTMQGSHHANFKLDSGGEYLAINELQNGEYHTIDALNFPSQQQDNALGRLPNGIGVYQNLIPSPNASNEFLSSAHLASNNVKMDIYPNPSFNKIYIKTRIESIATIRCISINGQIYDSLPLEILNDGFVLDVSHLEAGIYIIQLLEGKTVISGQKFVIKN